MGHACQRGAGEIRELCTWLATMPFSGALSGTWLSCLVNGAHGSNPMLESRALGRHSLPPCCPNGNLYAALTSALSAHPHLSFVHLNSACADCLSDMGLHGGIPSVSSISSAGEPSVGWIAGTSEKGLVANQVYGSHSSPGQSIWLDMCSSGPVQRAAPLSVSAIMQPPPPAPVILEP